MIMTVYTHVPLPGLVPVSLARPVHDSRGDELGTLDDVFLDLDHNRIAYATLHVNGSEEPVAVPWPELRRDRDGDFHLNVDLDTLRAAPRPNGASSDDPAESDLWLRELYLYYGHVPYRGRTMR